MREIDFGGRCAEPGHERRLPAPEPSIEGLVRVRDVPAGDESAGDPRPPGGLSGVLEGRPQNRLGVQLDPERGEPGHHLFQAVDAPAALFRQERVKPRCGDVDEIAEHVNVVIVAHRGDFDPGHERHAGRGARGGNRLASAHRVVVGDREHADARR